MHTIATVMIAALALTPTGFCIEYTRKYSWWRTRPGRSLFLTQAALAAFFYVWFWVRLIGPAWPDIWLIAAAAPLAVTLAGRWSLLYHKPTARLRVDSSTQKNTKARA